MRVEVLTDRPAERFVAGARLYPEGSSSPLTIEEARPADPGWVLRFREVSTRDSAEAFRLAYLELEIDPAETLPRGSYYWHEMVGVTVRDPDGVELGTVRDVYRVGATDILEVVGGPRGDFDLPITRPFVHVLAPRQGAIVADPQALDLPSPDAIRPPAPPRPPRPRRATRRRPAVPMAGSSSAPVEHTVQPPPEDAAAGATEEEPTADAPGPIPGGPP